MGDRPRLMPSDTPDYMAPAWAACMEWAISHPGMLEAFRAETSNSYVAPKNGLEKMIDDATGHGNAFCEAFIRWANVAVWGKVESDG